MNYQEIITKLGPLAHLSGVWEGIKGDDTAPSDDRGTEKNYYREKLILEPFGPVNNHEQELWGLKYSTMAWRLDEADSFHEETGYWLWDPSAKQVFRTFIVPRGISVLAGGEVSASAKKFKLSAYLGNPVYGICSNPFLDREFKTVEYHVTINLESENTFSYEEDTVLKIKDQDKLFHHIDKNTLTRTKIFE